MTRSLADRVADASRHLDRLPRVYRDIYRSALTDFSRQPPRTLAKSAKDAPPPRVAVRRAPESREPDAGDRFLRATCVSVARTLADAHDDLAELNAPVRPWLDHRLGHRCDPVKVDDRQVIACYVCRLGSRNVKTHVDCKTRTIDGVETITCRVFDVPLWTPPADDPSVRLPPPPEIEVAALGLKARLNYALTGTSGRKPASRACTTLQRAVTLLVATGEWDPPVQKPMLCGNCGNSGLHAQNPPLCKACHEYARRHGGADRPFRQSA